MNQRRSKFPITQNSFRDLRKTKRRVWTPDSLQIYWFDLYKEMTLQHFLNTEWALLSLFQSRPSICFIFFISPLSFIINQMDPFVTRESIHAYSKNWSLVYNSIYAEKSSTTIPILDLIKLLLSQSFLSYFGVHFFVDFIYFSSNTWHGSDCLMRCK